ncbi:MAG: hypothetical protein IJW83_04575 [Clostridia bacterium]|nr:hypothetical protein [Clostridia bacterium]
MKRRKAIRCIVVSLLLLIFIGCSGCIWYNGCDTGDLEFYDGEPIKTMCNDTQHLYFFTEDGKGYVADGYNTPNRTYRNVEWKWYKDWNYCPVLFYDGQYGAVKTVHQRASLFLTETGTLFMFNFYSFQATRMCDDISYLYQRSTDDAVYAIDAQGRVLHIDMTDVRINASDPSVIKPTVLWDEGVAVKVVKCIDVLYVLTDQGVLYEMPFDQASLAVGTPVQVYEDVKDFDVLKTKSGNQAEEATSVIHVLLTDGTLYVKGYSDVFSSEQWDVLQQDITAFSMSACGTIMIQSDTSCIYYGRSFDAKTDEDVVQYKQLLNQGVQQVYNCNSSLIIAQTDDAFHLWQWKHKWNIERAYHEEEAHDILIGEPFVIAMTPNVVSDGAHLATNIAKTCFLILAIASLCVAVLTLPIGVCELVLGEEKAESVYETIKAKCKIPLTYKQLAILFVVGLLAAALFYILYAQLAFELFAIA